MNTIRVQGAQDSVEQVMRQYQDSMLRMANNFLQTQEVVMLAYLRLARGGQLLSSSGSPMVAGRPAPTSGSLSVSTYSQIPFGAESLLVQREVQVVRHIEEDVVNDTTQQNGAGLTGEGLVSAFISLVSERTGYPVDMLEPSMDLETDLGIDSIKRVEVFSKFKHLLSETMVSAFEGRLEELASLRTIQSISDCILELSEAPQPAP